MKKYFLLIITAACLQSNAQVGTIKNIPGLQKKEIEPIKNTPGLSQLAELQCNGELNAVSAVALGTYRRTTTVFNNNGGSFDVPALLSTTIVTKESSCVIVHFSANTYIADNAVMYQVRIDGKPAQGHVTSVIADNDTQPVIMEGDEDERGTTGFRPTAHSFFGKVGIGTHKIEVMVAGCCSANTSGSPIVVCDNATLIVQYKK